MILGGSFAKATHLNDAMNVSRPPPILLITIERLKAGGEAEYGRLEAALAETCVRLECPNSYLALEAVTPPKEVWWLVAFASQADVDRVSQAYAQNEPLMTALQEAGVLKRALADEAVAHMTTYRADHGDADWRIGATALVVIAPAAHPGAGAVFETRDACFTIAAATTPEEAAAAAASLGPSARTFMARPEWSKPEPAWIAANPGLWRRT
jgi:hypothetical protein